MGVQSSNTNVPIAGIFYAEQWLIQDAQKEPNPTNLHREYISASLTAETASLIYRSVFLYFNKLSRLIANIRTSKKQLFFLPIEWSLYLVATVNILLVIFEMRKSIDQNFPASKHFCANSQPVNINCLHHHTVPKQLLCPKSVFFRFCIFLSFR